MLRKVLILIIIIMIMVPAASARNQIEPEAMARPAPEPETLAGHIICLDPGHGGSDPGTTGIDGPGYPDEKDHTLEMALQLKELLLEKGATVIMTRETDIDVSLAERCNIANTAGADIYLSIHCNAIASNTTTGTETFYWGVDAGTYSVNGKRLAEKVQQELVGHLESNDRGAIMDYPYYGYHLYVLDNTAMPAALAEVGFMSNQTEFDLLNTTSYRNNAAEAMLDGILRYFRSESSPIRVNSDAEMDALAVSKSLPGDGSAGNPYIIQEYDIDGTGSGYCVYIGNVTRSFIVRNCSLHRASGNFTNWNYDTGLYIYNCPNAGVDNVTAYLNGGYGIRIQNSDGAEVKFSDAHMNDYYGIYSRYSDFGNIIGNSANNNTYSGIILYNSENNTVRSCEIMDNNAYGIYMDGGIFNHISGNNIIGSANYGIYMINSQLCNVSGNIVNQQNEIGIYNLNSDYMTIHDNEVRFSGDTGIELSSTSNNNIVSWNRVSNTQLYGIQIGDDFGAANYINVHNNTVNDTAFFGIYVLKSWYSEVHGNTAFHNGEFGIYVKLSQFIAIHDNLAYDNVYGICLRYSSHDVTVRNNTCHSNNRFAASYITAGIAVEYNSPKNIIINNRVYDQNVGNGTGILVQNSLNNIVQANNMSGNIYGTYLYDANETEISRNDIAGNQLGSFMGEFCTGNTVANNNFYTNIIQANDSSGSLNNWDAGYPAGGNYWDDFAGIDLSRGQNQNISGSDGILDSQYTNIRNTSSVDHYPLASSFIYSEKIIPLQAGWNLISLPMRQLNWSFDAVFASILGKWDRIVTYNASELDHWKSFSQTKPGRLNDLGAVNHIHGYWVHMTEPAGLTASGDLFDSQLSVPLKAGWNLVGYPSMTDKLTSDALAGTGADMIAVFDAGQPYLIRDEADLSGVTMRAGEGYWVHVPVDAVWTVDW